MGKTLFWSFNGKRGQKMWKTIDETFLNFYRKLQQDKGLISTKWFVLGNILHRDFKTKTGPKWVFYNQLNYCIFKIFCMKLQQDKGWKMGKANLYKPVALKFFPKTNKIMPKLEVIWQWKNGVFLFFWMKLHHRKII